ncbi:MAG: GEVED domain-containing protein, partial [Bacteroidota bacterium]
TTASGTTNTSTYATPTTLPSDPSYYVCQVTCPSTGDVTQSNQGTVNVNNFINCYCTSANFAAAATAARGIVLVNLVGNSVTINQSSAANTTSPYFTLYSTPVADLSALSSYNLKVTVGTQATNNYGTAWIDYDHSGTFGGYNVSAVVTAGGNYNILGAIERVGSFGPVNASIQTTLNFTVPGSSLNGTTGMRVLYRYNSSAIAVDACGPISGAATTGGAGEVEDYRVTITTCTPPTTQASNNSTSSITTTSGTISWTVGNGTGGEIVVLSQGSAVNSNPVQGNVYTPNSVFGSGTQIGTGNYVVSQGVTSTVNVTGLTLNTTYYYAIYTYNSGSLCYKSPALTGSFTTLNGAMTYVSSTTVQQTGNVTQGVSNQAIVQLQVVMGSGSSPALSLSSFTFNTNGSSAISSDVTAARIWYTGNSSTYATTTQFGTDVTVFPGGSTAIPITGSLTLLPGTNYFWVAYDVNISATIANVLDAECPSITISSVRIPTVTAPAGSRPIVAMAGLACAYTGSNQTISLSTIVGAGGTTTVATGTAIDDNNYAGQSFPAGFNFEYNGQVFTSYGINSNGFIWFGSGTPNVNSYSPVGSLTASGTISGVLCAFGGDLIAHPHTSYSPATPSISVGVTGTAPNRIYTIEWNGFYNKAIYSSGNDGGCYP